MITVKNCHRFFETLATKLKLDIIHLLWKKPLSVNELSKELGQERSKVSHALKSLSECGFVQAKRNGKQRIYSLNGDTLVPLLGIAEQHVKKYCKICKKGKKGGVKSWKTKPKALSPKRLK